MKLENYPNPFADNTTISYSLTDPSHIVLEIYDMFGKKIEVLSDENRSAGQYTEQWDAAKYPQGVYVLKLTSGNGDSLRKIVVKN